MAHRTQPSGYQRTKSNLSAEKEQTLVKPEQQTKLQNGAGKTQPVYSSISPPPEITGWASLDDVSTNSGVIESGVLTHSDSQISIASQISEDGRFNDLKMMVKTFEEKLNAMQIDTREESSKKRKLERECTQQSNKIKDLEKKLEESYITIKGLTETCRKVNLTLEKEKEELMKMKEENDKLKSFVQEQYPNVLDLSQNFYATSPNDTNAKLTALHGAFSDIMHIAPVQLLPQQRVLSPPTVKLIPLQPPLRQRVLSLPKPTKVATPHQEDGPEYRTSVENSV